ncbi:MAG: hypothetical protein LKJ21_01540 [Oscillospiraceae bacterium]|nr:hypothetical protein [Oscillospiraceae bacterium]MCI1990542.1 hypothetical protein [Oscillospiraceae bacterium]MCI2034674.1 hypothetical protein [Oscillospiraceae bacterium]
MKRNVFCAVVADLNGIVAQRSNPSALPSCSEGGVAFLERRSRLYLAKRSTSVSECLPQEAMRVFAADA